MNYTYTDELYHHGILGMKWGKRNGPPYPLGSDDHSASEKKAGWRKSLNGGNKNTNNAKKAKQSENASPKKSRKKDSDISNENSKNNSTKSSRAAKDFVDSKSNTSINEINEQDKKDKQRLQDVLGLTDEEAKFAKQLAIVIGVSVGTTAGIYAIGALMRNNDKAREIADSALSTPILNPHVLMDGYNKDGTNRAYDLDDPNFTNADKAKNGDYVGKIARERGYDSIEDSTFLEDAINNPSEYSGDLDELAKTVRLKMCQSDPGVRGFRRTDFDAQRRLSCWSASNSYYLSSLTGKDFASKSYENLVNFNDFGRLYKETPEIFNALGKKANDYVGNYGQLHFRGDQRTAESLVQSIFNNIDTSNNATADGKTTVGFINAAYHSCTCTHQWNFELHNLGNGVKGLVMTDGYEGKRYQVASMLADGKIDYSSGMEDFIAEVRHYNRDSFRFYAPSLDSINTGMMKNVVLGKTGSASSTTRAESSDRGDFYTHLDELLEQLYGRRN